MISDPFDIALNLRGGFADSRDLDPWARQLVAGAANVLEAQAREIEALRAVPAGWKLVPMVPTVDMVQAAGAASLPGAARATYERMLAAAPLFEAGG